jgi:hypothetical protein
MVRAHKEDAMFLAVVKIKPWDKKDLYVMQNGTTITGRIEDAGRFDTYEDADYACWKSGGAFGEVRKA